MTNHAGRTIFQTLLYLCALGGAVTMFANAFFPERVTRTVRAQQDPFLAQRLNQIEQRYTLLESRLNRLEQEARLPSIAPRAGGNENELRLLASQMDIFQQRLTTLECGLVKLDERTLPPNARRAAAKTPGRTDPCRLNPNEPLDLLSRP